MANQRIHPRHLSNGDEQKFRHTKETEKCHIEAHGEKNHYKKNDQGVKPVKLKGKPSYMMSFTKGMPHDFGTGLIKNPIDYQYFVRAIDSGDPRDFRDTPLGPDAESGNTRSCSAPSKGWRSHKANTGAKDPHDPEKKTGVGLRAWESQSAGLAFELEGPDAQAVTMPPHPKLGSDELTAEMGEVYCQALLRDVPFNALSNGVVGLKADASGISQTNLLKCLATTKKDVKKYLDHTKNLAKLKWFDASEEIPKLNVQEEARRCMRTNPTPATAFRGITTGDFVGPYLSQFLLVGNTGINGNDEERLAKKGLITYGAISADQRVRTAIPGQNYMTTWDEWMDVQEAAAVGGLEDYIDPGSGSRRFIHTPRDLATYVHYDALYEAYLNACLIMLGMGVAFDPGIPFQEDDNRDHQQGFAHFGGPHILSLVTEVATRALKAVRFQKYNVHRRCRPEVMAARIHKSDTLMHMAPELEDVTFDLKHILDQVATANTDADTTRPDDNYLLPMAFCEGSPMHPAYGAGHATVAGACITILKAFFDHGAHLNFVPEKEIMAYDQKIFDEAGAKDIHSSNMAYVSVKDGKELEAIAVLDKDNKVAHLTVEGELNKLASNISIGRNWAGVHYFTDYYESLLMGEEIAIGILEEQKLMFGENFSMTVPLFGGDSLRI